MRAIAADDGEFGEAFPELFMVAYQVTYRILGDVTRAEDAAAEATARALASWRRVSRMDHRNGCMARVAGNVAIDDIRRQNRRRDSPETSGAVAADGTETAVLRLALGAAMAGLSTRQREVIALAAGLARAGDDPSSALRVVGPPPSSTTTSVVATTVLPPPPLPTTTLRGPTTTRAAATSTTRRPATTTSTTVPAPLRVCDAAEVTVTAAPERPSYSRPATVAFVATGVNRSSRACQQPLELQLEFFDSAGKSMGAVGLASSPGEGDVAAITWEPGETIRTGLQGPLHCGPEPCLPGTYSGVMTLRPFLSPPATFTVT